MDDEARRELHACIAEYLTLHNFKCAEAFCVEAQVTPAVGDRLEKRWMSVLRLQRQLLELEGRTTVAPIDTVRSPSIACLKAHRGAVTSVACHATTSLVVSGSEDGSLKCWDVDRRVVVATLAHVDVVTSVSIDDDRILSTSSDRTAKLWDVDGAPRSTLRGHDDAVLCGALLQRLCVTAGRDGDLRLWDPDTVVRDVVPGKWIRALAAIRRDDDAFWLAAASSDDVGRVFKVDDGALSAPVELLGHTHQLEAVAWAPTAKQRLATAARDATVRVWAFDDDTVWGAPTCVAELVGHASWVRALCWLPSGSRLVSAADDRTIKVWDLPPPQDDNNTRPARCLDTIPAAHAAFIHSLALHAPSATLLSAAADKLVKLWDCR